MPKAQEDQAEAALSVAKSELGDCDKNLGPGACPVGREGILTQTLVQEPGARRNVLRGSISGVPTRRSMLRACVTEGCGYSSRGGESARIRKGA